MALNEGDALPDFELTDQHGDIFKSSELKGEKAMVVYFYPKDFTPGCTKEACNFRDSYEDFQSIGAEVIGISNDSQKSHQKFANKHQLPFILLSDSKGKVRKKFGVKKSLLGLVPGRETFVFNQDGKLIFKFNSLEASKHMKKALKALQNKS